MAAPTAPNPGLFLALGISDTAIGVVLFVVGLSKDILGLVIAGIALGIVGIAMAVWASNQRNRPIQL